MHDRGSQPFAEERTRLKGGEGEEGEESRDSIRAVFPVRQTRVAPDKTFFLLLGRVVSE